VSAPYHTWLKQIAGTNLGIESKIRRAWQLSSLKMKNIWLAEWLGGGTPA
jgi:hypothetical protein